MLSSLVLLCCALGATDYPARDDLLVAAVDLVSGREVWASRPAKLGGAFLELFPEGLAVFPGANPRKRKHPVFVDAEAGKRIGKFDISPQRRVAAPSWHADDRMHRLTNGWTLDRKALHKKRVRFWKQTEGAPREIAWELPVPGYAEGLIEVDRHLYFQCDWVLWCIAIGERQARWKVDLRHYERMRETPRFVFLDGLLVVQVRQHILACDPASGRRLWKRDMIAEFKGDELGGSLYRNVGAASFARGGDTLVVAYEGRIFALDLPTQRILWRMNPDTFPHRAQPVVNDDTVFLTVGPKRKRAKD